MPDKSDELLAALKGLRRQFDQHGQRLTCFEAGLLSAIEDAIRSADIPDIGSRWRGGLWGEVVITEIAGERLIYFDDSRGENHCVGEGEFDRKFAFIADTTD